MEINKIKQKIKSNRREDDILHLKVFSTFKAHNLKEEIDKIKPPIKQQMINKTPIIVNGTLVDNIGFKN
jgi:hypothetical protein